MKFYFNPQEQAMHQYVDQAVGVAPGQVGSVESYYQANYQLWQPMSDHIDKLAVKAAAVHIWLTTDNWHTMWEATKLFFS